MPPLFLSCDILVHRQFLNSFQLAAKTVEVPLKAPCKRSGSRLRAPGGALPSDEFEA